MWKGNYIMSETKILVAYDEFAQKVKDSADLESVKAIITTEFPDAECQVLAIKAVLGIVDKEEEDDDEDPIVEPEEPGEEEIPVE